MHHFISAQLGSKAGLAETHWPLYWVALHWVCTGFDASLRAFIAGLVLDAKLMLRSINIVMVYTGSDFVFSFLYNLVYLP